MPRRCAFCDGLAAWIPSRLARWCTDQEWIDDAGRRARDRLRASESDAVVGHCDWLADNIRWNGDELLVVHDWDSVVADSEAARRYGTVFDQNAAEYDRNRPAYPGRLIDQAITVAGIGTGDHVLEIGCGTGQLTIGLLARGLKVTALEPGENLLALARENLAGSGEVAFVNARFEDAALPAGQFRAVFCASAFHWLDPRLSWQQAADVMVPGGTLALLQYFGLEQAGTKADQDAALAAIRTVAPDVAADWPAYRDLDTMLAGVEQRSGNVSQAWAWLGGYDIAQEYAGRLFGDLRVAVLPRVVEHTADQLTAILRTMSCDARLSPGQRRALAGEYEALYQRLGRPIRTSTVAALVTARRAPG